MPTIVAVRKGNVACIGADTLAVLAGSRKQSADYIVNHNRIMTVGSSYLGVLGTPSIGMAIETFFDSKKKKPIFFSVENIFSELCLLHKTLKEQYFLNPYDGENDSFESSRFESLIVSPYGIFKTYEHRSVQEFARFYAIGSGSSYAIGALDALYSRIDSPMEIAKKALAIAAEFDDSTGLPGIFHSVKLIK